MSRELIYELCWKYHKLHHQSMSIPFNEPIHEKIPNILQQLLDEVNCNSQLKDNYTKSDLAGRIIGGGGNFLSEKNLYNFSKKPFSRIKKEDIQKFVDSCIFKDATKYDFYFKFGWVADFPTGYKLGNGIFYSFDKLPKRIKDFLLPHMPYENERTKHHSSLSDEEWIQLRKRDAYLKISIRALGSDKAQEKAFAQMNKNYNIYKILTGTRDDLSHAPFYFCMRDCATNGLMLNEAEQIKWNISKFPYFDEHVKKINKIFNKKKISEIEERILDTIEVYGLIESNSSIHVKFTLCITALETLLMGDNEKDYLGLKLAQKISFLLADIPWWLKEQHDIPFNKMPSTINQEFIDKHLAESRLELYTKVKGFYKKRSKFSHTGKKKKPSETITKNDYQWASYFVQWSVETMINLSKKYTHMSKSDNKDKKSLELYFEKLIFE